MWSTSRFTAPIDRQELYPQLAVDGNTLYLAYTQIATVEGGCGDLGLRDVGVFFRTRPVAGGAWSEPTQVGEATDHLVSIRAVDGTLHLAVIPGSYYETFSNGTVRRYPIDGLVGSLRVGSDGRARTVSTTPDGITFGVFTGSGFDTATIPDTSNGYGPVLVLGSGNVAHVLWNRGSTDPGCTEPPPEPTDGSYYSTNATGSWRSERITADRSDLSLTVDTATGRVHALVGTTYYTKLAGGAWTGERLGRLYDTSPVVRQDPATGTIFVLYVSNDSSIVPPGVYYRTLP